MMVGFIKVRAPSVSIGGELEQTSWCRTTMRSCIERVARAYESISAEVYGRMMVFLCSKFMGLVLLSK